MTPSDANRPSTLERTVNRRTFLRAGAAGIGLTATAGWLTACGGGSETPSGNGAETPSSGGTDAPAATESPSSGETPSGGSSSSGEPRTGGTLIFNGGSNPSGLDPHTTGATVSWYVLDNVFDRLVRLDAATQEPAPSLAEKVNVSDDGLTYTFTLRSGVKFHNGREMTAQDVKESFERIMDPDVPAVAKGYFEALQAIETPDDSTVQLIYEEAYAPLLIALTRLETAIVPMEEVAKTEAWETKPIGTGPFKLESFVKDQGVVLVRNDDYWEEGLPYLDSVEQRVITQNETAVVNLRTATIHVTPITASDIGTLQAEPEIEVAEIISANWAHLSLNTARPPFDDLRVRQAIRVGINREDIRELAFFGTGMISNTPIPEGNPFRAEVDGWDYDPERARALLKEAGLEGGFSTTLRIISGTAWHLPTAQIVQENLAELNINVEIEQIESTTWFSEVFTNHDYEMSMVSHVSKVDPDLSLFDIQRSGELGTKNYTNFNDPEMDELLDRGRVTTDPEERKEIYAQAQKVFVERSGYIVLNLQMLPFGVQSSVQNFLMLPTSELRWKETWLQG